MNAKPHLWFAVDEAMGRLLALSIEARAATLVAARRSVGVKVVSSIAKGGGEVVAPAEEGASPLEEAAAKLARDKSFAEGRGAKLDIVALREELRRLFQGLRATLSEALSEFDTFSVLFPLVVHCDELVATATSGGSARWETLQAEFFETENGGEKFYAVLDARLRQDETHPLVLQAFYYCLSAGFCGIYERASTLRAELQARLAARITLSPPKYPAKERVVSVAEVARFPWAYYGIAAAAVLLLFGVFMLRAG